MLQANTGTMVPIPRAASAKPPKSKADVLDQVAFASDATIKRVKGHVAEIHFADTNATFLLTVHKPRGPRTVSAPIASRKNVAHRGRPRGSKNRASH